MNRRTVSAACLMTLLLAAAAWGQNTGSTTTGNSVSSILSTLTGGSSVATSQPTSVKKLFRAELAQLLANAIQGLFSDLRANFGLPAQPTNPAGDPLAILETLVTDAVDTLVLQ